MLPVTNSYWFRESCLLKFCFTIICEERKQKVLILNSSEKFIMFWANIGHVRFNMVNSKHRYCRCLLIKIYRPHRIVFTFHENLSDEKLPEMKRTFLFFWNLKRLVTCYKMNHTWFSWYLLIDAWLGPRTFLIWKTDSQTNLLQKNDLLNALLLNET